MFAKDLYMFYVARIIGDIGDAILYSVLPIYVGEVTTPRVRGTWGSGQTFSFNAGFFLINIIGSYLTIQQTAYIFLPSLSVLLLLWISESPYYYVKKRQEEKARISLQWFLRKNDIESDFVQLKKDVERQTSESGSWIDLFQIRSNRRALVACIFLRAGQQFSGISVIENYTQIIFQRSGTALSPQVSTIIFAAFIWVVMPSFSFTLDMLGRRKSFMYASLSFAVILLAESVFFYVDEIQEGVGVSNLIDLRFVSISSIYVLCHFYCAGLGILPSLMAGELFSTSIKAKAFYVSTVVLGLIITITTIFQSLVNSVGLYAPFLIFSVCTFIVFALSFYIIPEISGKTLEEIQQYLKLDRRK